MDFLQNIQDEISQETIDEVLYVEEVYQHRLFKESVEENQLEEITAEDLNDAVELTKAVQDGNKKLVRKYTRRIGTLASVFSLPMGIGNSPVEFSISGLIGGILFYYDKTFSKEVELRKWIIAKGTYTEVAGNRWIDNWRFQWNIRCSSAKYLFQVFSTWATCELFPRFYRLSVEAKLSKRDETGFMERASELGAKYRGRSGLDRFPKEEETFPINDCD